MLSLAALALRNPSAHSHGGKSTSPLLTLKTPQHAHAQLPSKVLLQCHTTKHKRQCFYGAIKITPKEAATIFWRLKNSKHKLLFLLNKIFKKDNQQQFLVFGSRFA
jgi:hypothetical protein